MSCEASTACSLEEDVKIAVVSPCSAVIKAYVEGGEVGRV
jgi:hypothetical protein